MMVSVRSNYDCFYEEIEKEEEFSHLYVFLYFTSGFVFTYRHLQGSQQINPKGD